MNEKEKAEVLIELCKLQMEKFHKSRGIEWKMNFTLWSLIVATGATLKGKLSVDGDEFWVLPITITAIVSAWHFIWLVKMQASQDLDFGYYQKYRNDIEKLLPHHEIKELKADYPKHFEWLKDFKRTWFWPLGDALVTFFLLIVVCLLLSLTS